MAPFAKLTQVAKDLLKIPIWQSVRCYPGPTTLLFTTRRGGGTWLLEILASVPGTRKCVEPMERGKHNRFIPMDRYFTRDFLQRGCISNCLEEDRQVIDFISEIKSGRFKYLSETKLWRDDFYFSTRSLAIKLHTAKPMIHHIHEQLPTDRIIYQVRHPIPAAQSAMRYRSALHAGDYLDSRHLTECLPHDIKERWAELLEHTQQPTLQHYLLDWCLENLLPLSTIPEMRHAGFFCVTYEEMVVAPDEVAEKLSLFINADFETIRAGFNRASKTTDLSSSRQVIEGSRETMTGKWLNSVSPSQIQDCQAMLEYFNIDLYSANDALPQYKLVK